MFSRLGSRLLFTVLVLLLARAANANSIFHINQAVVSISPNFGEGDNVSSVLAGPGISISGGGGAACGFCFVDQFPPFVPGQILSATVDFIAPLEFVSTAQIGGTTYPPDAVSFGGSFITAGSFTFPSGGNSPFVFTVTLPAFFADVHGAIIPSGEFLTLAINPGKLVLNFDFVPATGGNAASYIYSGGKFVTVVPEPGTLVLMGSGLALLAGQLRRKNGSIRDR